ncbi:MAG: response regulator transcription factor, partial [Planctomycetota bacterium]
MTSLPIDALTPREREILTLIAEGDSLAEIAQKLSRSLKTIESHRLSIGRKLKASNRVELAKIAIAHGLVGLSYLDMAPAEQSDGAQLELHWLCAISEDVRNAKGKDFVNALCAALNHVLGVRYAAVCLPDINPDSNERQVVSYSEHGKPCDPYCYDPTNKPSQQAIETGSCVVPKDVRQAFPDDPMMSEYNLQSYVGIRLDNVIGPSAGVLAVAHDQPLDNADAVQRVLRFFAARTVAELSVAVKTQQLNKLQRQIKEQSDNAGSLGELAWLQQINKAVLNTEGETFLKRFCDTA